MESDYSTNKKRQRLVYCKFKYLLIFLMLGHFYEAFTQTAFTNNGYISNFGILSITGELSNNASGNFGGIINTGDIQLTGNLYNQHDSLFSQSSKSGLGLITFCGSTQQKIYGTGNIMFYNLTLKNNVLLKRNIQVLGDLNFEKGKIYLDTANVFLYKSNNKLFPRKGKLVNESEQYFADGKIGYIGAYDNSYNVNNIGNLGFIIANSPFNFMEVRRDNIPVSHTGDGSINRSFNVIPELTDSSILTLKYLSSNFDNAQTTEADFKIWSSNDKTGPYRKINSEVNVSDNEISTLQKVKMDNSVPSYFTIADENCLNKPGISLGNDTSICDGALLTLRPTITNNNGKQYQYFFQGNFVTPLDFFEVRSSGFYNVMAIDETGCFGTDTIFVRVNPLPVVNFSVKNGCLYDSIKFTNSTSGFIAKTIWNFGDNTESFELNPSKKYSASGTFQIELTSISDKNCTASLVKPITIYPVPDAKFKYDYLSEKKVKFTNIKGDISSIYEWHFHDNLIIKDSVIYEYADIGTYFVKHKVIGPGKCTDSTTQSIKIIPEGIPSFIVSDVCVNDTVDLINTSTYGVGIPTHHWKFGDGTEDFVANPVKIYKEPGSYIINLRIRTNLGWEKSVSHNITVHALPKINFDDTIFTCLQNYELKPQEKGTSYFWSDSSSNPVLNIKVSGKYSLTLGNESGCYSRDTVYVLQYPKVEPNLGKDTSACGSYLLDAHNPGSTYSWSNHATTRIISVTESKEYSVIVTDNNGCEGFDTVDVNIRPVHNFSLGNDTIICDGTKLHLDITPVNQEGYSCEWNDHTKGFVKDIDTAGIYWANITNSQGCLSSDTIKVYLNKSPELNLGEDLIFCTMANTELNANCPLAEYSWSEWGIEFSKESKVVIADTGLYTLKATYFNGCFDIDTIFFGISPQPSVSLGKDTSTCEKAVTLIPKMTNERGLDYKFFWQGDLVHSRESIVISITDTVSVFATGKFGCNASDTVIVNINPLPETNFTFEDKCLYDAVNFTNTSSIIKGSIDSVNWNFGDGKLSNKYSPIYKYEDHGIYNVNLTAFSDKGCASSYGAAVRVYQVPDADFEISRISENLIYFENKKSSGLLSTYKWYFPGKELVGNPVVNTFSQVGTYPVKLEVISEAGKCIDSSVVNVEILNQGMASFSAEHTCTKGKVEIINRSTVGAGTMRCYWTFGDGTYSEEIQPVKTYDRSGKYKINLLVQNGLGWEDTVSHYVEINPPPVINFGDTISTCSGHYELKPEEDGVEYFWSDKSTGPTLDVTSNGFYWLTMQNENCSVTDSVEVILNSVVDPRLGKDTASCGPITIDAHNPGSTYDWSNGINTRELVISESGTYSVTVTDKYNCQGSDVINVTVRSVPGIDLGNDTSICEGQVLQAGITAPLNENFTFKWNDQSTDLIKSIGSTGIYCAGITSPEGCTGYDSLIVTVNSSPVLDLGKDQLLCSMGKTNIYARCPYANYSWTEWGKEFSIKDMVTVYDSGTYILQATFKNKCSDRDTIIYSLSPTPIVTLGEDISTCDNPVTLVPKMSRDRGLKYNYFWQGDYNNPENSITVNKSDTITVLALGDSGCYASDTIVVNVNPLPSARFTVENGCIYDSIKFVNTSLGTLDSLKWSFGDGAISDKSIITHKYSESGLYNVSLNVFSDKGCSSYLASQVRVYPAPDADFETEYNFNVVSFENKKSSEVPSEYSWYFPGEKLTGNPINKAFSQTGTYPVKLVVLSDEGNCIDSSTQEITILPQGIAAFSVKQACVYSPLELINKSTNDPQMNYVWTTGDKRKAYDFQPKIIYNIPDTYEITLTISKGEWYDTDTHKVIINPIPVIDFEKTISVCSNHYELRPKEKGTSYLWSDSSSGPMLNVTASGSYSLILKNTYNCSAKDSSDIYLHTAQIKDLGKDTSACGQIMLDAYTPGATYLWSNGSTNSMITVNESDLISVIITKNKCISYDTVNVTIRPIYTFNLGNDITICDGQIVNLSTQTLPEGYSCEWFDNSREFLKNVSTEGNYWVKIITPEGCESYDTLRVKVNKTPKLNLGMDKPFCTAKESELFANCEYATYSWKSQGIEFSNDDRVIIGDTGTYILRATYESTGCWDEDTINFVPAPYSITPLFLVSANVKEYDTVVFVQLSDPDPTSFSWDFGDGVKSILKSPTHIFTYPGEFKVKMTVNNGNCDASMEKNVQVSENLKTKSGKFPTRNNMVKVTYSTAYPNPNNGRFNFDFSLDSESDVSIQIYNISGILIDIKQLKNVKKHSLNYNLENIADGLYILRIATSTFSKSLKVIVRK